MAITTPSPLRCATVDAARKAWIRRLIDTSRRNNLLYYRELKTGTLDMTGGSSEWLARLLMQDDVALSKLLPTTIEPKVAEAKMADIRARAVMNFEERGIETLFLAMGMASWDSQDGERPPEAAIFLVPLKVAPLGRGGQGFLVKLAGEIQANLVLLHMLETDYGVRIKPEELLSELQGDDEDKVFDPTRVGEKLRRAAKEVPGFTTTDRLVIGNFAFQKTAMVRDLSECAVEMSQHDLIAAIAGDLDARQQVRSNRVPVDPSEIDRTMPDEEFLFLDADSSQQLVIRHALAGQDGTIQGPPGTGKSQTIANMIAEFAAHGSRALFVAEKRAALEVVLARLEKHGLDHLALDLHGADISRRDVMAKLHASIEIVRHTLPAPQDSTHARLVERRNRLVAHVHRLHGVCPPTGRTLYNVQGRLLKLGPNSMTHTRWRESELDAINSQVFEDATELLHRASNYRELFLRCSASPWNGAELLDGEEVRKALVLADDLACRYPEFLRQLDQSCNAVGLRMPTTISQLTRLLTLLQGVLGTCRVFKPALFTDNGIHALAPELSPAGLPRHRRAWAFLTNPAYRHAIGIAQTYRLEHRVSAPTLRTEILAAEDQDQCWRELASRADSLPQPLQAAVDLARQWEGLARQLETMWRTLRRNDLRSIDLAAIVQVVMRLHEDRVTPPLLPKLCAIERSLEASGVQSLVDEMRSKRPNAGDFVKWLEHAWLSSALERAHAADIELSSFLGRAHDNVVGEFRQLDQERITLAADRIRRAHAERAVAAMQAYPIEADLVRRESQKKSRGMSIRNLVAAAPHVLTALRPCWMASPLSVSHLLPVQQGLFDIVLFDEASQVLPEDAVPALLRAEKAIVAGDCHQLPPTTFFAAGDDADGEIDDEAPSQGFESILSQMTGLFEPWQLDWHYRSLDESLIAFSNRHIYGGRLVTFPGPGKHQAIEHHLVTQAPGFDGQEDSVSEEVRKVVELVLHHATERCTETLGVIALGIKHQRRIERALDEARRDHPELDAFFDENKKERFFVKNLERVQGDERDAIILTVGYGKDRAGHVCYRFGPLLYEGGERRLNVAVTRARRRMTIVSSFGHRDMDPARSHALGVQLLRLYLEFASSGGRILGDTRSADHPLNDFEEDVFQALTQKGLCLYPQWGSSRYRIDLAATHPRRKGRLVLAIECDGASYHSGQSARDRDRLRQQHLEALGWRFHRIWSTDWFQHRDDEIARAVNAYETAIAVADRQDVTSELFAPSAPERPRAVEPSAVPQRGKLPISINRGPIAQYSDEELVSLVEWVQSDGLLRTDHQLLDDMVDVLGFARRGSQIVARIDAAITNSKLPLLDRVYGSDFSVEFTV